MKSEKGEVLEIFLILFTVLIIALIIIAVGCMIKEEVDFGIKEGTIIDKDYNGGYMMMVHTGNVTIPQYHPASWRIKIQKEVNGENKELWTEVDKTTYHNLNIGDFYPKEER